MPRDGAIIGKAEDQKETHEDEAMRLRLEITRGDGPNRALHQICRAPATSALSLPRQSSNHNTTTG